MRFRDLGQRKSLRDAWLAINCLVYRLTGSAALLGAFEFDGRIPAFGLSPIAAFGSTASWRAARPGSARQHRHAYGTPLP